MASLERGIAYFAFWINHLVDSGETVEIEVIEEHLRGNDILDYIELKYQDIVDFSPFRPSGAYNREEINEAFGRFSGYIEGNEDRKFAVSKNGLCLLIALSVELLKPKTSF